METIGIILLVILGIVLANSLLLLFFSSGIDDYFALAFDRLRHNTKG